MSTHWKKLCNPDYIGAYMLDPGQELTVQIKSVQKKLVKGPDGKQEECIVADLVGQKPMILNRTNCKMISKVYGSAYIEDWAGKKIIIYAAKVKAFGDVVEALRIRDRKPELEEMTPNHPKWETAKKSLKNGIVKLEQIKLNYKLSVENEKAIQM